MNMDKAILDLVGAVDYDPEELKQRYAYERDIRLRPDGNQQYTQVTSEFSNYVDDPYAPPGFIRPARKDKVDVVLIGGGFGGLLTAVHLRKQGIENFLIVEQAADFGGTWYWNRYPGLRCDTEAYCYLPLLEEIDTLPSEKYSRGSEIYDHIKRIAEKYDLYDKGVFQTIVTGIEWDDEQQRWHVHTNRGDDLQGKFVAMANGPLNKAKLPGIPGIETFTGKTFHTSRWDYEYSGGDQTGNLTGFADKRVGIIGTGATGVQVIPEIAKHAEHLYVFQRTPAAVDVRANKPTEVEWFKALKPGWQKERIDNFNRVVTGIPQPEDMVKDGFTEVGRLLDPTASWAASIIGRAPTMEEGEFISDTLDDRKMNEIRARIDDTVADPETAEALKPWHRRWCKRPLFSDDYLQTFNRPNVTLVDTAGKGVERITDKEVFVAGKAHEIDCLIFATGYEVGTEYTKRAGYDVVGRGGLSLADYWSDGMKTFQGFFVRGFPNCMFIGFGQNAVATNMVFMLEEQAKHVAYAIGETLKRGGSIVEPSQTAVEDYIKEVAPMSISQLKFWVECTPSYMNGEGTSDDPNGFFANLHPSGTVAFYEMLSDWRAEGEMRGLEITSA